MRSEQTIQQAETCGDSRRPQSCGIRRCLTCHVYTVISIEANSMSLENVTIIYKETSYMHRKRFAILVNTPLPLHNIAVGL